jgi:hypothetical protein
MTYLVEDGPADLGVTDEEKDVPRLPEFEGEHQAGVVGVTIEVERKLVEGAEPVVINAPPSLIRILISLGDELLDFGKVGIGLALNPMLHGKRIVTVLSLTG